MPVINKNGARKFHPPWAICPKNCEVTPDEKTRFLKRFNWITGKLERFSTMMSNNNASSTIPPRLHHKKESGPLWIFGRAKF
jgi:hypothetical protein